MRVTTFSKEAAIKAAFLQLEEILAAGGVAELIVKKISKTREQEKKYHAIIGDIAKQTEISGQKYSAEVWKALLIEDFAKEKAQMNEPLERGLRLAPALDGSGRLVTIRPSSTDFSKIEGAEFIEYLLSKCAEYNVKLRGFYE